MGLIVAAFGADLGPGAGASGGDDASSLTTFELPRGSEGLHVVLGLLVRDLFHFDHARPV
jgi:hypothetical protein